MKKVLVISFHFPPRPNPGAQRPFRIAKYLPRFGWEPIVLTAMLPGPPPAGVRVIQTPYRDILRELKAVLRLDPARGLHQQLNMRVTKNYSYPTLKGRCIRLIREALAYPDEYRGWFRSAVKAASGLIRKEGVDVLLSSSYPVTAHLIAREIKVRHRIPWVADLRDLWTQNHYCEKNLLIRTMERRLERRTLSGADLLTTVSPVLAERLRRMHPGKEVLCITNGYDPEDFDGPAPSLAPRFTITYTGTLYNGKRDPAVLFEALRQLMDEGLLNEGSVELRLAGPREPWLEAEILRRGLGRVVRLCGVVGREEALRMQRTSHLLLLLLWGHEEDAGVYTAKLFEYLGACRPILAVGAPGGVAGRLLQETGAGVCADTVESVRRAVLGYYSEFLGTGTVREVAGQGLSRFRYDLLAGEFAGSLDHVSGR